MKFSYKAEKNISLDNQSVQIQPFWHPGELEVRKINLKI